MAEESLTYVVREAVLKFTTPGELLRYVQERSDDLEKVVIPQFHPFHLVDPTGKTVAIWEGVGMVLYFALGGRKVLNREDAERVLNDGILHRMKVRIELFAGDRTGDFPPG